MLDRIRTPVRKNQELELCNYVIHKELRYSRREGARVLRFPTLLKNPLLYRTLCLIPYSADLADGIFLKS